MKVERDTTTFGGLATRSLKMARLFADLAAFAPCDLSLILEGETGVGKEVIAEAIHRVSRRAAGPFVVFDCAANSPPAAELGLFGARATAADDGALHIAGALEQATHGTLVLDHVDALSLRLQARLQRALEYGENRLGGRELPNLDLRVIAITTRNLRREANRGRFRQSLYLLLAGMCLRVPPLRERLEDVPLLVRSLLAEWSDAYSVESIPTELWRDLERQRWTGNVRELKNVLQRSLLLQG